MFKEAMAERKVSMHHVHCKRHICVIYKYFTYLCIVACTECGSYAAQRQRWESEAKRTGVPMDRALQAHILDQEKAHLKMAADLRLFWTEHVAASIARQVREGRRRDLCKIEDNMSTVLLPSSRALF